MTEHLAITHGLILPSKDSMHFTTEIYKDQPSNHILFTPLTLAISLHNAAFVLTATYKPSAL